MIKIKNSDIEYIKRFSFNELSTVLKLFLTISKHFKNSGILILFLLYIYIYIYIYHYKVGYIALNHLIILELTNHFLSNILKLFIIFPTLSTNKFQTFEFLCDYLYENESER
jgi:hypothetical protein